MAHWYPLEPVDESFFTSAPQVYRYPIELSVPPERVWESLASDESLKAWGLGVRSLTWTTPRPFGVDTTREVVLPLHAIAIREKFFVWDEGTRYAFYAASANRPLLKRFAEDYVIEKTPTGCRFTWTIAIEARPVVAPFLRLGGPLNRFAFGQVASAAKKYFAQRP